MSCLIVATTLLLGKQVDFASAWKLEQEMRSKQNDIVYGEKSTPDQIRAAIPELEKIIAYTLKPEIDKLVDGLGYRAFWLQRYDLRMDLMAAYARLNEPVNVAKCLRDLREGLEHLPPGPEIRPWGPYYGALKSNTYLAKHFAHPAVKVELDQFAARYPGRRFEGYPYSTKPGQPISMDDKIVSLGYVWSEAKYNFINWQGAGTLDWDAAYRGALDQVKRTKTDYEFYNVVRELVGKLGDSHTDVSLPQHLRDRYEVGLPIPTRMVAGELVVTGDSPVGIKQGEVIETIDGESALAYGERKWGRFYKESTPQYRLVRIYTYMLFRGPKNSTATLGVRAADGSKRTVRAKRDGKLRLAPQPPSAFKILPDGTAYFAFNTCVGEVPVRDFEKALSEIQTAGRLIIDIRINGGGNSSVGWSILSHLIDKPLSLPNWKTVQYRAAFRPWGREQEDYQPEQHGTLDPKQPHFAGPVVVLTSPISFSAAEDFASLCLMSKRVTLMGEPTGGSTGQPVQFQLPGGGWGRFCSKRDWMADGTEFVGVGVLPQIRVEPTVAELQKGGDPLLERAVRFFRGPS